VKITLIKSQLVGDVFTYSRSLVM